MEIQIQLEKDLLLESVINVKVYEGENIDKPIGEVISYDPLTGVAICNMNENENE